MTEETGTEMVTRIRSRDRKMLDAMTEERATFITTVTYPSGASVRYFKHVQGHDAIMRELERRRKGAKKSNVSWTWGPGWK